MSAPLMACDIRRLEPKASGDNRGDPFTLGFHPMLRGWCRTFAIGDLSPGPSCRFRDWVEKKIRHHLVRASQRHGFGWKRWSRAWLYGTLGFFADTTLPTDRSDRPFRLERPHNPCREAVQERVVR